MFCRRVYFLTPLFSFYLTCSLKLNTLSGCCLLLSVCYRCMDYALPILVCIFAYRCICLSVLPVVPRWRQGCVAAAPDQCRPACPRRDLPRLGVERRRPQNLFCLRGVMGAPRGAPSASQPRPGVVRGAVLTHPYKAPTCSMVTNAGILRSPMIPNALREAGSYRRQHRGSYTRVFLLFNFLTQELTNISILPYISLKTLARLNFCISFSLRPTL